MVATPHWSVSALGVFGSFFGLVRRVEARTMKRKRSDVAAVTPQNLSNMIKELAEALMCGVTAAGLESGKFWVPIQRG